ncbi:TRAP transporter small permease [Sporosarcina sp. E16_3]|uniref:TRAP transporter small permease n=1 Tax=Sporosarcina sp. E16_3 TaxID=2789293 RepID=UPI001A933742|nr:TRAP transporter small permease [Sporosarcina sp. E16_3]MBO0603192.1 TRAP transporter small permease [Sporosarcina sp. E16_3]
MDKVISRLEEWIVAIVLAVMSIIAFVNILSRGLANYSLSFTEEITVNLFVLLTFVGTAIGVRQSAHLGFTLIYDRVNHSLKRVMTLFVGLMMVLLFGTLLYFGIQMVSFQIEMGQRTPSLGWPQWWFSLAMPVGALLCLYRTLQVTVKEYREHNVKGEQKI